MKILFISISSLPHVSEHGISLDLLHEFKRHGHDVFIICSLEKHDNKETYLAEEDGCRILRVKIGENKGAGILRKGLTTLLFSKAYISAIKKNFADVKFDLVLYPTPPITHVNAVKYIKKRDEAKTYLLLKDIFPQNAVDIGMLKKTGIKGSIYKYFRTVEKELYAISDYIGCMSQANVDYVLKNNPDLKSEKVMICPNSIEVTDKSVDKGRKEEIRIKYSLPLSKTIFVYGGNLGKPQDIPFIIECLKKTYMIEEAYFLIVGDGTEYEKLARYMESERPGNVKLMKRLPKEEYDDLIGACDVGLIFLDHRFTIPNFPSRLLGYLQVKIPVLACTDRTTDIGEVIERNGFGWSCRSEDPANFVKAITTILNTKTGDMGEKGYAFLSEQYSVERAYGIIMDSLQI